MTMMGTVAKPDVHWYPAHPANYLARLPRTRWEGVGLHITAGGMPGPWFAMAPGDGPGQRGRDQNGNLIGSGATHYCVSKGGRTEWYVRHEDAPHAHGSLERNPRTGRYDAPAWIVENWEVYGISANATGLSIEHEGHSGEEPTPEMFDASTRLSAWLTVTLLLPYAEQTRFAINRERFFRHSEVSPVTRGTPGCPGWKEDTMKEYVNVVERLAAQPDVAELIRKLAWANAQTAASELALFAELRGMYDAAHDDELRAAVRKEHAQNVAAELGVQLP